MHSLLTSVLSALAIARSASAVAVSRQIGLPGTGNGTTNAVTLDIVNAQLAPDGFSRSMVTANGTYPGPLIRAQKGDTLMVTVNNRLTDASMRRSTSMDFDGVFFDTADAHEEGSPFVTACPLGPNTTFTHVIPLGEQTGTFWYHSQLDVQYVDGLRGPLIIYDPDDPQAELYDVDDETTIIQFGDHWHNSTLPLLAGYEATGVVPVSDSSTVNGAGRFNGGPEVPFSVTPVQPGKRHRLRLINESARNVFTISIDNHTMTIIEADGVAVEPLEVNQIDMLAGQRYSVVLEANQPIGNYWINAPSVGGDPARNPNQNASLSRAILRYDGAPDEEPAGPLNLAAPNPNPLVEAELVPFFPDPPPEPDINMTFTLEVVTGKAIWNVNNVSYVSPETPTLVKILDGASNSSDFNVTENTFVLPPNKTVQITFPPNDDDDAHPFHLHGNNFWVVKSNTSEVINTVNPPKRDVVGAGAAGIIVRFTTDKPGPWFFHCHIFWHLHAGLATVMAMDPEGIREGDHPGADWEGLCPAYDALPPDEQ